MSAEAVPFRIGRIDHVALRVRDIRAAVQWYERVLGMEHRFKDHPDFGFAPAMLHTGDGTYLALVPHDEAPTTIESTEADVLADSDELRRRFAAMSRPFVHDHVAFNVTPRNYVRAREALPRIHNLQVWDADHGLQQSLYFRDLDAGGADHMERAQPTGGSTAARSTKARGIVEDEASLDQFETRQLSSNRN